MDHHLSRQLKRFTALMVGIQGASLAAILSIFVAFNYVVKVKMATLAQEETRHSILAGDLRQAISVLDDIQGTEFTAVRYFDRFDRLVFSVPPESQAKSAPESSFFRMTKILPLQPSSQGGASLGRLEFVFSAVDGVGYALLIGTILLAASVPLANIYRRRLQGRYEVALSARYDAAVARTTQMLAHDVRKPFSLLRIGLTSLSNAADSADARTLLGRLIPEVDRALNDVDGLIKDVMEVGNPSARVMGEDTDPETLIETALTKIFRIFPEADVALGYEFRHRHMVKADPGKVGRVLANILENALHATACKGDLWLKTRESDGVVTFCVGNSGSYIPAEDLTKIFDLFVTKDKKGGTGLGLAIAQKIVIAHGGSIWGTSIKDAEHPHGKVEFWFTLPAAKTALRGAPTGLPSHSSQFMATTRPQSILFDPGSIAATHDDLVKLESEIIAVSARLGRPLGILVVDDEDLYRNCLISMAKRSSGLKNYISLFGADGSDSALKIIDAEAIDLAVTDIDLGPNSQNGYDLVGALRRQRRGYPFICVHSNRLADTEHRVSLASGADLFLSKPMARAQLLTLALRAAQRAIDGRQANVSGCQWPEIAIIEDNAFAREAWATMLKTDAVVHTFASPEAFLAMTTREPGFLARLSYVVTDFRFKNSGSNGFDVANRVRARQAKLPVLLSSDRDFDVNEVPDSIDRVVGKNPVCFAALEMARS